MENSIEQCTQKRDDKPKSCRDEQLNLYILVIHPVHKYINCMIMTKKWSNMLITDKCGKTLVIHCYSLIKILHMVTDTMLKVEMKCRLKMMKMKRS